MKPEKIALHLINLFVLLLGWSGLRPPISTAAQTNRVIRVTPAGSTSFLCGSSWDLPCQLQHTLIFSSPGDEIWVAAGTYKPGINYRDTFQLRNGVALYGGFAGTETSRDQRDWQANLTVLSGDIGVEDDIDDNSFHVVSASGVDASAILDGFTITAGNPERDWYGDDKGGGIYNLAGSPTLTHLIITGNFRGGLYNEAGSPVLTEVTFINNLGWELAEAMLNIDGSPILTQVIFSDNAGMGMVNRNGSPTLTHVTFNGNLRGGLFSTGGSPILTDVIFTGNYVNGGMTNYGSNPILTNVTFIDNHSDSAGGMKNYDSSPVLTNVTFKGNFARGKGGGMSNWANSNPTLINVTFSGNTAAEGGGIFNDQSSPTLINVTFSGNQALLTGGGLHNRNSSHPGLTNTILWDNTAEQDGPQIHNDGTSSSSLRFSDIQGGCTAIPGSDCSPGGNIDADPLFLRSPHPGPDNSWSTWDDDYGDLRLGNTSPAIDAGDNTAPELVGLTADLAGEPRFYDVPEIADTGLGTAPLVDLGAFERQANLAPLAEPDHFSTLGAAIFQVEPPGVLANDRDPNGDPLSAVLLDPPVTGTLTLNPDGSFDYLPEPDYTGQVSFAYFASDGLLDSNLVTVTITVNTYAPQLFLPLLYRASQ